MMLGGGTGTGAEQFTEGGGRTGTKNPGQPADARKKGGEQDRGEGWTEVGAGKKKRASRWSDEEETTKEEGGREPGETPASGGTSAQGREESMGVEGTSSSSSSLEICEYRPGKRQRFEAKEMGRMEV